MVIGKGKRAVEEHFDRSFDLEQRLVEKGDQDTLDMLHRIADMATIHYVWQKDQKGLGDAVYQARHHINDEPFAVLLGDTVAYGPTPVTAQLLEVFAQFGQTVIGVEEIEREKVSRYGVVGGTEVAPDTFRIEQLVEKPAVEEAPSSMVIAGRYILTPEIFEALERTPRGKGDEVQLTDAIHLLLEQQEGYALRFDGRRFDVGNPLDFIKTNVLFALQRDELKDELQAFLKDLF